MAVVVVARTASCFLGGPRGRQGVSLAIIPPRGSWRLEGLFLEDKVNPVLRRQDSPTALTLCGTSAALGGYRPGVRALGDSVRTGGLSVWGAVLRLSRIKKADEQMRGGGAGAVFTSPSRLLGHQEPRLQGGGVRGAVFGHTPRPPGAGSPGADVRARAGRVPAAPLPRAERRRRPDWLRPLPGLCC